MKIANKTQIEICTWKRVGSSSLQLSRVACLSSGECSMLSFLRSERCGGGGLLPSPPPPPPLPPQVLVKSAYLRVNQTSASLHTVCTSTTVSTISLSKACVAASTTCSVASSSARAPDLPPQTVTAHREQSNHTAGPASRCHKFGMTGRASRARAASGYKGPSTSSARRAGPAPARARRAALLARAGAAGRAGRAATAGRGGSTLGPGG